MGYMRRFDHSTNVLKLNFEKSIAVPVVTVLMGRNHRAKRVSGGCELLQKDY